MSMRTGRLGAFGRLHRERVVFRRQSGGDAPIRALHRREGVRRRDARGLVGKLDFIGDKCANKPRAPIFEAQHEFGGHIAVDLAGNGLRETRMH